MDVLGPLKTLLNPASSGSAAQPRNARAGEEGSDFSAILADGDAPRQEAMAATAHKMPGERHTFSGQKGTEATDVSQPPSAVAGENEGRSASGEPVFPINQEPARGAEVKPSKGGDVVDMAGMVLASRTESASAEGHSAGDGAALQQTPSGKPATRDAVPILATANRADSMSTAASGSRTTSPAADAKRQPGPPATGGVAQFDRHSPPTGSRPSAIPGRSAPVSATGASPNADATGSSGWPKAETSPASAPSRRQAEPGQIGQETRFRLRAASDPSARHSAETAQQRETPVAEGKTARHMTQAKAADGQGPAMPLAAAADARATGQTSAVSRAAALPDEAQSPVGDRARRAEPAARDPGAPGGKDVSAFKGLQQVSAATASEAGAGPNDGQKMGGTIVTSSDVRRVEPDQTTNRPTLADATQQRAQSPATRPGLVHSQGQQTAGMGGARPSQPVDASPRFERPASGTVSNDPSVSREPAQPVEGRQPVTGRDSKAPIADWHAAKPSSVQPVAAAEGARPSRVGGYSENTPPRYPSPDGAAHSVSTAMAAAGAARVSPAGVVDGPVYAMKTALSDAPVVGGASAPVAGVEAHPAALATPSSLISQPGAALETVRQLIDALPNHAAGDRTVLSLEPAELGHLEIEFKQDHGRMTATVSVERPETLDLLRRHADMLMRDLAAAGYADAEVAFGDGTALGQGNQGQESGLPGSDLDDARASEDGPVTPQALRPRGMIAGRLDIRL